MLDEHAVGLSLKQEFFYSWRDVILYNLSVGAKADELQWVFEKNLQAVPTFALLPALATFGTIPFSPVPSTPVDQIPGIRTDGTIHMDQKLVIYQPVPLQGCLDIEKRIIHVYDRGEGKGVKVVMQVTARDSQGEVLFISEAGSLNRRYGGFGGEQPPRQERICFEREPDLTIQDYFPENAAVLYRLTGDTFPLHADPAFAEKCGFKKPILQGLCSLGYACRMLADALLPGEPERMSEIETQFRSPVCPGTAFTLQVWKTSDGTAAFRMVNDEDGTVILDGGKVEWKNADKI